MLGVVPGHGQAARLGDPILSRLLGVPGRPPLLDPTSVFRCQVMTVPAASSGLPDGKAIWIVPDGRKYDMVALGARWCQRMPRGWTIDQRRG